MEIEFNPNSVGQPVPPQPPVRQDVVRPAPEQSPFQKLAAMEDSLKDISLVRPEKVDQARGLVGDVEYPPDEVLNSIASLLAMKIGES